MPKKERPKVLTERFNFAITPELKQKAEALAWKRHQDLAALCRDLLKAAVDEDEKQQ